MAIRHSITLSTSEPNNEVGNLKIRQGDEQTQTLVANITENGVPKPFVGLQPFFCAKLGQTAGLGIIEQKVTGPMNPANGTLEYVMQPEDWQQLGRQTAYFSFRKMVNDHEWTEQFSTRDFNYNVTKSVFSEGLREVKKDGSTYVWTIEDMLRLFKEYIATGKIDWENYKNDERTIWEKFVEDNREFLENADPGGKIILELLGGRGGFDSLGERLDSDKAEVTAQLAQMPVFAADFGVSYKNISTVNSDALDAALAVALAENRELILPVAPNSDDYIRVARGIVINDDNFKISGHGRFTRIRMMVHATQFVTLNGNHSVAEGFDVIGTEYPDGVVGDLSPGNVAVQVTGDYCTVNDVQGDVLMSLVRVYDDGGKLIESPKVTNIKSGHNVAFGLLASHTNNLIYDNITGSYSYHKGRGEPPHLIYIDHTHGPNRNLQGGYAYAENGTGSFAFQFKGCIGGNAGHLVAKSCEGVYHVMDSENFGVKEIYSEDDQWDNVTSGAITLRGTDSDTRNKNLSIDKAYVEVKNAKGFYCIRTDNSVLKNITVRDTRDVPGIAYAPFHLGLGDNNQVINPVVENDGHIMSDTSIWMTGGKNNSVDNPTTKGNWASVLFDPTNTGINKLINYDLSKQTSPANIRYSTIVTPDNSVDARTAKSLIAHTDVLSHWDGSQYRFVDSGQAFEWVSGVFKGNVTDGYLFSDSQVLRGNIGVVDTAMTDIQISGDVYYKTEDALVMRAVDNDNYLEFKFYGNNVLLRAKRAGVFANLSQVAFPGGGNIGRLYNFKATIYGDRIECYIDGVRYIDFTLTTADATLFGTATKFGIFGQGTGGKWTNLRWVKLK